MTAPDPALFTFRPVDPPADADLLHTWVTDPKAPFWLMSDASRYDVERAYADIAQAPYQDAFIGSSEGRPVCLLERYDPARVELAGLYDAQPGDLGMHFLVAPADRPVHGFTRAVIAAVMAELFADPGVRRVVVEPDVRNTAIHTLNATVGFEVVGRLRKPEKEALLSVCTREAYEATLGARRAAR
ncbi:Protein N-acetyltransferase, RimJ/RimL family [Actinacidiphila yanglinensis]|uniref:Lysine N-acyltransferase MbtK n=1 Tax=Actinacidiphila yanglinensis TaxID=310779 RepID=A0A1H6D304_9ACTN|nr:GNAT family N-acetyltransferase [Actinacidiphila yanglinensis]SEG79641.1 Protein N-acetyltransferase, RimJ/RimL family [Actinacidiphila yanglinensis]